MSTQKTIKLYDETPYETKFKAKVVSCEECQTKKWLSERKGCDTLSADVYKIYKVILDQTLFFPEEGGQSADKGTMNDIEVVDVQIVGDIVEHYLACPFSEDNIKISEDNIKTRVINKDDEISGVIDWEHRFSNMQQHSAEHIFSGIVNREYGFHLSDNVVTMDYDGVLSAEQIEDVEWKVNRAITENIEIDARYPDKEELERLSYRSKIEIDGPVRIVTIPGYDVCACCAPHVKRTGEIGILKVMSVQNYKGGVRVSILCGFRVLKAFGEKNKVVSSLTNCLSTGQELLFDRVSQLKNANQELKIQIGILKQDAMLGKIEAIDEHQKHVILFEDDLDTAIVRNVVNALMEKHVGNCAVFTGNDTDGYRFILGCRDGSCKETASSLKEHFGAKCGGSQTMIQGSLFGRKEEIQQLLSKE